MRFQNPVAVLLLVVGAVAQDGATPEAAQNQDLEKLIAEVRAAHRGGRTEPFDRFRAALRFKSVAPGKDSIEVDITATFLAPRFLRYVVEEPGEVLERGFDDRGAWHRIGERVESIGGPDQAMERDEVRKQVGLARQLLGFLDPTSVLERLDGATGPQREDLALGRKETVSCDVVTGIVDHFPMFAPPEDGPREPRCGLRVWVDAETHRLVAVMATPLDASDRPAGAAEFLLLRDYTDQQQVAVPRSLLVYHGVPWEKGRPEASVAIRAIDLDPDGVSEKTVRRPGG